jgi:hypothetical protein
VRRRGGWGRVGSEVVIVIVAWVEFVLLLYYSACWPGQGGRTRNP